MSTQTNPQVKLEQAPMDVPTYKIGGDYSHLSKRKQQALHQLEMMCLGGYCTRSYIACDIFLTVQFLGFEPATSPVLAKYYGLPTKMSYVVGGVPTIIANPTMRHDDGTCIVIVFAHDFVVVIDEKNNKELYRSKYTFQAVGRIIALLRGLMH